MIRQFRNDFPAFTECIYMNLAGRGILSRTTREALDAGLDEQMMGQVDKSRWKASAADARQRFADLIHAHPNEIACTKNVSDGLNAIATALPWAPGDNVVYCPEFDHPNATYAWLNLSRMGVECRAVPLLGDGRIDNAAVIRATDSRTRLVTVASVNFLTGMRAELGELGRSHAESEHVSPRAGNVSPPPPGGGSLILRQSQKGKCRFPICTVIHFTSVISSME